MAFKGPPWHPEALLPQAQRPDSAGGTPWVPVTALRAAAAQLANGAVGAVVSQAVVGTSIVVCY